MKPCPHWNTCLNADGSFNLSSIMQIAVNHARVGGAARGPWRRVFATELRTVWQVARGMKCSFEYRRAAA